VSPVELLLVVTSGKQARKTKSEMMEVVSVVIETVKWSDETA
jgi:hypothetical protein